VLLEVDPVRPRSDYKRLMSTFMRSLWKSGEANIIGGDTIVGLTAAYGALQG
jgi:hypothetical protein